MVVTLLALAVVLLGVLVAGLLRSHAAILRRLHELGVGLDEVEGEERLPLLELDHPEEETGARVTPAAEEDLRDGGPPERDRDERALDLAGAGPSGETQTVRVSDVDHDTILAFLSTGCATCAAFWEAFAGEVDLPVRTRLVVVTKGPEEESPHEVESLRPARIPVLMSTRAWEDYRVPGSPYIVHVQGRTGRIVGEGTGQDWEQVRRLFAQATGDGGLVGALRGRRKARGDAERERQVDRALLAAGITPGDERLYGTADAAEGAEGDAR